MSIIGSGACARRGDARVATNARREVMPVRIPYNFPQGMLRFREFRLTMMVLATASVAVAAGDTYTPGERRHWAFQPRSHPSPPTFSSTWVRNPIDAFILAQLRKSGLKPAPAA